MNRRFQKVGVVGSGTMGSAIAQGFAMKGLEVVVLDQEASQLERGLKLIREGIHEAKERKLLTEPQAQSALERIRTTTRMADLSHCSFVVEAVYEDLAIKRSVFHDLEQATDRGCILASNTSSFLVSDIAEKLSVPERVIGVHYFYHAAKNKLVEIIPGERTAPTITRETALFFSSLGKFPILVKDSPGFAVNRFFVPWLNEAVRLYEERLGSIAFIDQVACETFAIAMGPFALMNATGVPIAKHAAEGLAERLGSSYAPARRLVEQAARGTLWDLCGAGDDLCSGNQRDMVRSRLIQASLGIAAQMVREGVTDAASADLGARAGLRWPKGPFEMAEELSSEDRAALMGEKLPALRWVRSRVVGSAGFIEFDLPDRLNPLGPRVMDQLGECWQDLESNSHIDRIIFTGRGKAFVAGADVKFFIDAMEAQDLGRIERFTREGQALFERIGRSSKTTIAFLDGLTLGGGLELALACHSRVATNRAVLAFPETGIGIYPGLGGTQRTARLIGRGLAKWLISTGQFVDAPSAVEFGLVDEVIEAVWDVDELAQWEASKTRRPFEMSQRARQIASAFEEYDGKTLSSKLKEYEKYLVRKAPVAQGLAMQLIDEGLSVSLEKGLELELSHLREIFSTKDAAIGLKSIVLKTRPEFQGR